MDLYERVFQGIFKRLSPNQKAHFKLYPEAKLSDLSNRLTILSRMVSGTDVEIHTAENVGGLRKKTILLPSSLHFLPTYELNVKHYLYRTIWHSYECEQLLTNSNKSLAEIKESFGKEYPTVKSLEKELFDALGESFLTENVEFNEQWLYGKEYEDRISFIDGSIQDANVLKSEEDEEKEVTEIEAKPIDEVESIAVDKKKQEDYVFTHNFEKVETLDEFNGTWRDFDGEDELQQHKEALDELHLKNTVRVNDTAHSVYKAEFASNLTIAESKTLESSDAYYLYPEWDFSSRAYKNKHCKVFPVLYLSPPNEYAQRTLWDNLKIHKELQAEFSRYNNEFAKRSRLAQGDHINIDDVTDFLVASKAGKTADDKIYLGSQKKKKKLSLILLLDLSLSSDGYAANNRVIDIEKQVAILMGEVWNEYEIDFQVDGFYSKTRNFCIYTTLKQFDQKWTQGKYNIGSISPQGYTRIGPALRHAGALLKKRENKNKWVIVLSDGKPNDFDQYEGNYGIKDIKKAIEELKNNHINSFAFAIEKRAHYYLPQMFGHDHYKILHSPKQLIRAMSKLYGRLI